MQMPIARWGYVGMLAAVGAGSFGAWQGSVFAGVWMRMLVLFLPVHLMVVSGWLGVLRQAHHAQEPC